MRYIIFCTVIFISFGCVSSSQNIEPYCRGDNVGADPMINNFKPCSYCDLDIADLNKGFTIKMSDPEYKVTAFKIVISDQSGTFFRKSIVGNRVTSQNVKIIKKLKAGDIISLECINIFGYKKRAVATSIMVAVAK